VVKGADILLRPLYRIRRKGRYGRWVEGSSVGRKMYGECGGRVRFVYGLIGSEIH
jgi:hypothetical protein